MKILIEYLDSLKETLKDIDVISIVNTDFVRVYHSLYDFHQIGGVFHHK